MIERGCILVPDCWVKSFAADFKIAVLVDCGEVVPNRNNLGTHRLESKAALQTWHWLSIGKNRTDQTIDRERVV